MEKDTHSFIQRMPMLFIGHGNPLYAIQPNIFADGLRKLATELPKPRAILCISAHWTTRGTYVTAMQRPRTIHDFGGFPQALYDIQYPAPGSPALARRIQDMVKSTAITADTHEWGLDHGCWSVLLHLFPKADIPVVELSIDDSRPGSFHYTLGKELAALREEGILIVASGNNIHNLRMIDWEKMQQPGYAYEWAQQANTKMKQWIVERKHQFLIDYLGQGKEFKLAAPTPEHLLPLLYILALQTDGEKIQFFNDQPVGGSLSMLSIKVGE